MAEHIWVRSSSMPKALLCPQSVMPVSVELEDDLSLARLGSSVHELLEWHIRLHSEPLPPELHARILSRHGILSDKQKAECKALFEAGQQAWAHLKERYPEPSLEKEVKCVLMASGRLLEITGHIDLSSRLEDIIRILDWKSGREEFGYEEQVQTYGYLEWRNLGAPSGVTIEASLCFLRSGNIVTRTYTAADMLGFEDRIIQRLGAEGETYAPGEHCSRCKRRHACLARNLWLQDGISVFDSPEDGESKHVHARAFGQAKALKKTADRYLAALKTEVEINGAIPTVEGKAIQLVPHGRGKTLKEAPLD